MKVNRPARDDKRIILKTSSSKNEGMASVTRYSTAYLTVILGLLFGIALSSLRVRVVVLYPKIRNPFIQRKFTNTNYDRSTDVSGKGL